MRMGRLLGAGRTADVYEIEDGAGEGLGADGIAWVLRRYRVDRGDATAEAEVMEYVRGHGYPVPCVRTATPTASPTSTLTETGLSEARARRAANPTMSEQEVQLLGKAEKLIRGLAL
ncbi:hypothetical protein [Streptomyces tailanensis]|uniref:hypothetical protein n=1 Tax=Streptomyces tailanensis TaxID=2569858 RepID=UPI00122E5F32